MSPEGRRRVKLRILRSVAGAGVLGLIGWGAWEVATALRTGPGVPPAPARSVPIRDLQLSTDGVLDRAWLERTLALPRGATLMELDLGRLRARLLGSGQVRAASIVRKFPSSLGVAVSERTPVGRLRPAGAGGPAAGLLVARDGVAYEGSGYDPALIQSLPWLDGARAAGAAGGLPQVAGMEVVADLLSRAQLEADPIYRTWESVSLARLQTDGEIEIRSREGLRVIFGTQEDFLRQLAKLDLLLDKAPKPGTRVRLINLAIAGQAAVSTEPIPEAAPTAVPAPDGAPPPVFQIHLN